MFDLTECNPSQREAVTFGEGPLLLLAGPGSGKTFTITKRILWLIQEKKVAPERILVITFTREAAVSMKQRFLQASPQANPVNFGTFHSVFYQILLQSGRIRQNNILTDRQKLNLIVPILKKKKDCNTEIAKSFLAAIGYYKNTGEEEKSLQKLPQEWQADFTPVYQEYEAARRRNKGLDFDDMLKECEELLQRDALQRQYWQSRFSHILIDEFQDINYRQYCIIKILAEKHKNVFAVGDDDQAIYGFRGARPACMMLFEKEFGAARMLLGMNYRSHQDIVEAALKVINANVDRFPKELTACEKNLRKNTDDKMRVRIRTFRESADQLQYLITQLKTKETGETGAVLFRTNLSMQGVAARLTREGIPFTMKEKTGNIYDHFIVRDLMAYLRIAEGTAGREEYLRVVNKPFRNISREAFGGEASLQALGNYYADMVHEFPERPYRQTYETVQMWIRQMEFVKRADLTLAVSFIRKACGYDRYLRVKAAAEQKEDTLREWEDILDFIAEDIGHYRNLREWQEAQTVYGDKIHRNTEKDSGREKKTEGTEIRLLTVHAAKGLEFDHVWIPDCNEKNYPHGNLPDPEHCEEERRVFYVAMTRAKKDLELLCLTGTGERPRFPSRFLIPLNPYRR